MAYQLKNEHMVIDIAKPGDYNGSRFDWSGFITGVALLEGNHAFCVPESLVPGQGTGGAGLCNEFGIKEAMGYGETRPGEAFPKLGIGLLTKPDGEKYDFSRKYPIKPFDIEIEQESEQKISFRTRPENCGGYAADMVKTVMIDKNLLIVEYSLHNVGEKPIVTEEYCHNFLGIDGHSIGPDYTLNFPFKPLPWADEEDTMDGLCFGEKGVTWRREPTKPFYFRLPGFEGDKVPWMWELLHTPSGAGVRELSQFNVSSVAVWGDRHVVSPEMFIDMKITPGERKNWARVYEFFSGDYVSAMR